MKNILIFPAGSEIGLEINNALKYQKNITIFGGTSVEDETQFTYRHVVNLPFINEPDFIECLNLEIDRNKIDYIYPAYDMVQCSLMERQEEIHAEIISSERDTVLLCRNKQKVYDYLKDRWYVPQYYKDEITEYPVFIKPKKGQGSLNAYRMDHQSDLEAYFENKNREEFVVCEYLPGKEFTVDCFTDASGNLLVVKARLRERIKNGISVSAEIIPEKEAIRSIAEDLNRKIKFRGAWFFQIKENKCGELRLLEVSPRVSGTMGLTRNLGINFEMLDLYLHMGVPVQVVPNDYELKVSRTLISHYQSTVQFSTAYVDYDDTLVVNSKVNTHLLALLYQFRNQGKEIILISKHRGDIHAALSENCIAEGLFSKIITLLPEQEKAEYIEGDSIFIDDSFSERKRIREKKGIPVFDLDTIEALTDWRM